MRVAVTQRHIDEGVGSDPHWCPIACAIREQHDAALPAVGWDRVTIAGVEWELPWEAQDFVRRFDELGEDQVKPLEFEMEEWE